MPYAHLGGQVNVYRHHASKVWCIHAHVILCDIPLHSHNEGFKTFEAAITAGEAMAAKLGWGIVISP